MDYKELTLKNLYKHVSADRYRRYENMEEEIRDIIGHIPKDEIANADKELLLSEYREYFLKKYVPVKADHIERFHAGQLVRWIFAQLKTEIT